MKLKIGQLNYLRSRKNNKKRNHQYTHNWNLRRRRDSRRIFEEVITKNFWNLIKDNEPRMSLVIRWLRIRLTTQGTRVPSLVWEDPTCCGAAKPLHHNRRAHALWSLCFATSKATAMRSTTTGEEAPLAAPREGLYAAVKAQNSHRSVN